MKPNRADWASLYIGLPWVSGGRGPKEFDCWGLVRWVYKEHFGIDLPSYPGLDATDRLVSIRVFSAAIAGLEQGEAHGGLRWGRVGLPQEGDGVAMGACDRIAHVGIFTEVDGGLVIHAVDQGGVVAATPHEIRAKGMRNVLYFRPLQ